jgi:FkbM family methyltransferase
MSQRRPFAMRILPPNLAISVFDRFYSSRRDRWLPLYQNAGLLAAPGVSMRLIPKDRVSDLIAFTGIHENAVTQRVVKLARKGGTMIDIGANLGYFSLLWAGSRGSNRCIAFEAGPRPLGIFFENIQKNGLADRIQVIPHAAAAKPGKLFFDVGPEDQLGWGGIAVSKGQGQIEIDAVRVDSLITVDEPIALLKVDIEGADAWALMGCERLLQSKLVEEICFEQNKPRMEMLGIQPNAAQEYLESVGYRCTPLDNTNDPVVQWSAVPS